jgi:hypothetical protein
MKCSTCKKKIKTPVGFHREWEVETCIDCYWESLSSKQIRKHRIDFSILAIMLVIACGMLGLVVYTMSK